MGRRKYSFTPEMDEEIRRCYRERVGIRATRYLGPVKALAEKMGLPRWRISKRAVELEILPVQKKEPDWSDTEIWILKKCAHRCFARIQIYLKRAGYQRTIQGIRMQKKRMKLSRNTMDGYTANSLSLCFGTDVHTVMTWIRKGWLKAEKRGTARTPQQGGDEWFIRPEWVRGFIKKNVAVIDFRKLDKYWLVEMLAKEQKTVGRGQTCPPAGRRGSEIRSQRTEDISLKEEEVIPEITDPDKKYEIDPKVLDLFDEVQRII